MLFVHPATSEEAEPHFAARWPDAAAVADPEQDLYRAFGLGRGSALQLLGPRVWLSGLRALGGLHGVGRPTGDPLVMPGAFLVRDGAVTWSHVSEHAGDVVSRRQLEALADGAAR